MTLATWSHRLDRARYRIGQGLGYLFDRPAPDVESRLRALLPPRQWDLIARLTARDQAHHLDVYRRLQAAGCDDPDLLLTALLHDCGKVDERGRAGVSQRTLLVLLNPRFPAMLRRAGSEAGNGWRHGLYLAIEHPRLGAALARVSGCSERVCWLIEHHHDRAGSSDDALRLLKRVDDEG